MNFSTYNTFSINSCLLENAERRLDHHDDHLAHHDDHLAHHDDHLAHHDNQLAKLHQQLKPQTSEGSTANGSYQFILCSFVMDFYSLNVQEHKAPVRSFDPAFSSINVLSLCPSICPICAVNFSHFFVHVS